MAIWTIAGAATAILFLLPQGVISHWHRVDALEIWVWQAGAPLLLEIAAPDAASQSRTASGPISQRRSCCNRRCPCSIGNEPRTLGAWSLVSCIVAPAFLFSGFVMAPPGWQPTAA